MARNARRSSEVVARRRARATFRADLAAYADDYNASRGWKRPPRHRRCGPVAGPKLPRKLRRLVRRRERTVP